MRMSAYDMGAVAPLFAAAVPPGPAPQQQPQSLASLWSGAMANPSAVPLTPFNIANAGGLSGRAGLNNLGAALNAQTLGAALNGGLGGLGGLNGSLGGAVPSGGGGGMYGAPPPAQVMEMQQQQPKAELQQIINGFGKLTWLSSKAGLITCANGKTISFQIKDFCDNQLVDLTVVLRVGFTLSFQAAMSESNEYIATLVSPLYGQESEKVFANSPEANLEDSGAPQQTGSNKDAYCLRIEERAIPTLLAIFQRHATPQIQLSSLHSQMSSVSGSDDELFRYVGSSSLKRRQFIERRTHLFTLSADDTITLQQPSIYSCVLRLASHLLRRGGVTAIETLYEFYLSHNMPHDIKAVIGETRGRFIELMQSHPWIFSLFPNRTYVSVRRNLPHYDYPEFVRTYFAECDLFRPSFPRGNLPPQTAGAYGNGVAASAGGGSRDGRNGPMGAHGRLANQSGGGGSTTPTGGGPQPLIPGVGRHASVGGGSGGRGTSMPIWDNSEALGAGGQAGNGTASDWFGSGGPRGDTGNTWRPQPLMSLPAQAHKMMSTSSTQTDVNDGVGQAPGCVCSCNCGAKEAAKLNRTSFSGPSASHSPPNNQSPSHIRNIEAFLDSVSFNTYDPFGYDLNSDMSALNLQR